MRKCIAGFLTGMLLVADQIELGKFKSWNGRGWKRSSREPTEATIARLKDPAANMTTFRDNLALTLGSAGVAMILTNRSISTTGHSFLGGISLATQWSKLCVGTSTEMTTDPAKLLTEASLWQELGDRFIPLLIYSLNGQEYALHQVGRTNHDSVIQSLKIPPNKRCRFISITVMLVRVACL